MCCCKQLLKSTLASIVAYYVNLFSAIVLYIVAYCLYSLAPSSPLRYAYDMSLITEFLITLCVDATFD